MKNLKTKIGLSVLALACVGAGALNLQPKASVDAADYGLSTDFMKMTSGAEICVSDDFSGIRWKTTVRKGFPFIDENEAFVADKTQTKTNGVGATFGVVVAPTANIEGELTSDTLEALELEFESGAINTTEATTYYSVINFDALEEAFEQKAYALNLTARAYVKYEGVTYYSDSRVDTTRSARQIAIDAELTGKLDDWRDSATEADLAKAAKVVKYYGGTQVTAPAALASNSILFNEVDNPAGSTVDITWTNVELGSNYEVYLGVKKVDATYDADAKTLTIANYEVDDLKLGEQYFTVFNGSEILVKPVVKATKVLTKAEDLAMFQTKGGYYDASSKVGNWKYWSEEEQAVLAENQVYDGYYVLGNNIDAEGYVHGSRMSKTKNVQVINNNGTPNDKSDDFYEDKLFTDDKGTEDTSDDEQVTKTYYEVYGEFNDTTYTGYSSIAKTEFGLMGTFNGMGYSISNLQIGSEREGMFGSVNGGSVKNVAILDVKATGGYKYVLADNLVGATIENVYIRTDAYETTTEGEVTTVTSMGYPMANSSAFAGTATGGTKIESCLIHFSKTNENGYGGLMFNVYYSDFTCKDVYAVTDNTIGNSAYTHCLMYLDALKSEKASDYSKKQVWLAENESIMAPDHTSVDANGLPTTAPLNNNNGKTVDGVTVSGSAHALYVKLHNNVGSKTTSGVTTYTFRARALMMGAYRYNSFDALYTYNTTYTNLANTGCWSLDGNNQLVWGN